MSTTTPSAVPSSPSKTQSDTTMQSIPRPTPTLTLIVAATPKMGIGRNGQLPWPPLKNEMGYFARVTRRAPAGTANAVIMGRRTWESIPPRFRPLKGRVNVVLTRRGESLGTGEREVREEARERVEGPVVVGGLIEAVRALKKRLVGEEGTGRGSEVEERQTEALGKVFVIGGAEVYTKALEIEEARRVLLTRVKTEFECDTFFPVELQEDEEQSTVSKSEWRKCTKTELDEFTGEDVPAGLQKEDGVEWEFEMWERKEKG